MFEFGNAARLGLSQAAKNNKRKGKEKGKFP